jgi:hypothetical protein
MTNVNEIASLRQTYVDIRKDEIPITCFHSYRALYFASGLLELERSDSNCLGLFTDRAFLSRLLHTCRVTVDVAFGEIRMAFAS